MYAEKVKFHPEMTVFQPEKPTFQPKTRLFGRKGTFSVPISSFRNQPLSGPNCVCLCAEAGSNLTLPRKCRLLIKSSMGDGVMVYTSAMYLRPGAVTGCVDYVQFGQDDFIPFITYRKSDKEPVQADNINLQTISQLKR